MAKIIAILGKSGSGKTTVAEMLAIYHGIQPISSCTTRPKRTPNETGHAFLTDVQYDAIPESQKIAETVYGGYRYCGVINDNFDVYSYVIDEKGLQMLKKNSKFDVTRVLVLSPEEHRKERTDEKRFLRDNQISYKTPFDHIILNHQDLQSLKTQVEILWRKLKHKLT